MPAPPWGSGMLANGGAVVVGAGNRDDSMIWLGHITMVIECLFVVSGIKQIVIMEIIDAVREKSSV